MTDDAGLLAAIARVHERVDPVPEFVREAARAAFHWRDPDAEVAELVSDGSLADAGVRAVGGPRLLSFAVRDLTVDLEVHARGDRRRVLGVLNAAGPGVLRAGRGDVENEVSFDALGRFVLQDVTAGPFRLRWRPATGPAMVTSWITL
jgi:hypothetical protein